MNRNLLLLMLSLFGSQGMYSMVDTFLMSRQYQTASLLYDDRKDLERVKNMAMDVLHGSGPKLEKEYPEWKARFGNLIGDCALEQGHFSEALQWYQQSEKLLVKKDSTYLELYIETLNKIGYYYLETKAYDEAFPVLQRALELAKKHLQAYHLKIAHIYNNLGNGMMAVGELNQAVDFHDQALSIRSYLLTSPHPEIAQSYNNRGSCWRNKGQYNLALADYNRALEMYIAHFSNQWREEIGDVHFNLGDVYNANGDVELSSQHYQSALQIYETILPPDDLSLALLYNNLGNFYGQQEQYSTKARRFHEQSLAIRQRHFGAIHPDVGEIYYNMGAGFYLAAQYDRALACLQESSKALHYQQQEEVNLDQVNQYQTLLAVLRLKAHIKQLQYEENQDQNTLLEAFQWYQALDLLVDHIRRNYATLESKLSLAATAHGIYSAAIPTALALDRLFPDGDYAAQAFYYSEKSKGLLLLEGLKRSDAQQFAGVPEQRVEGLRKLEARIIELEKQLFFKTGSQQAIALGIVDSLETIVFNLKQERYQMLDNIEKDYPAYYQLLYDDVQVTIPMIQEQLLRRGQTLVDFFVGNGELFAFVMNADSFQTFTIPMPSNFRQLLHTFQLSIQQFANLPPTRRSRNISFYHQSAYALYQVLIEPIEEVLTPSLIIVPSEELGLLPFEALIEHIPKPNTRFKQYDFLINKYEISYNYSVALLEEMSSRKPKWWQKRYLGVAPVFESNHPKQLANLKYTTTEVNGANELFGGDILLGNGATKASFLANQDQYRMLHLATHGKADPATNEYSFLAFSLQDTTDLEASLLFVKDIYNQHIPAELLVLSACETGLGTVQSGEGIASIARSFSYAGASSIIATQWSVNDKATSELIRMFFEQIKMGHPKQTALAKAKRAFIQNQMNFYGHPYFWAPFIQIGAVAPIRFWHPWTMVCGVIVIGVILYLLWFWWWVRHWDRLLILKSRT